MIHPSLNISQEALADICRRYHIRELNVFGSATREDFGPESDVDVLVEFEPGYRFDLWNDYPDLIEDLKEHFGREIDLVQGRKSLVNPFRRKVILESLERLYAA